MISNLARKRENYYYIPNIQTKNKLGLALTVAEPKDNELWFQTLLRKRENYYYITNC